MKRKPQSDLWRIANFVLIVFGVAVLIVIGAAILSYGGRH